VKKIMKFKYLFILFNLFLSTHLFASPLFEVLERSEDNYSTFIIKRDLFDLESSDSFDGKFFKIVKGKSNDAIKFSDSELKLKAATVYFHLTKSRTFWIDQLKSTFVENHPKIIVRLEIINLFDDLGHFANERRQPQFNNAVTIPAGETPEWVPEGKKDKWDSEIWFRPSKKILSSELPSIGPNPLTTILRTLEGPYVEFERGILIQNILQHLFSPNSSVTPLWESFIRFAGTYALTKSVVKYSRKLDPLFMEKWYYLDSAMVPEIIYHEFAHIALSDKLELSHSTSVNEGMADYFAAIMTNKSKIYHEVSGFSNSAPKDTNNRQLYSHWLESNSYATSDFVLSLLWEIRQELGVDFSDKLILDSRNFFSTSKSTISNDLIKALLKSCKINCEDFKSDRFLLYSIFSHRGF